MSDPDWVRAREFDLTDLSRHTLRIEEFVEVHIRKESLGETAAGVVLIELSVALPTCLRLDRLLSAELGYSRSRLLGLHEQGKMRIDPVRKDAMRRRVRDGTRIFLDR